MNFNNSRINNKKIRVNNKAVVIIRQTNRYKKLNN